MKDYYIMMWKGSSDGIFCLTLAYISSLDNNALCNDPLYSAIWNWRGPEKVRVLLWKIGVNVFLKNENRCS